MGRKIYCGVDIGGTKILAALMESSGKILARKKCPTPPNASSTKVYQQLQSLLNDLFDENALDLNLLKGIGIGVPGIVMPNHTDILRTPNIKLANFPLAQRLSKLYQVKVILGNDVNLGLLGEKWLGIGRNYNNIIGLFPGTGVGGGIIIEGKLLMGAQGAAGELGHMIMDQDSSKESAGVFGSLEALASRRAIEREIREAIKDGKDSVVKKILGKNLSAIKSKVLAQALEQRDPVVVRIVNDVCKTLGNACISMRHIFNPDLIVLGGGVMEACGHYILPRVRRKSNANPFLAGIDNCRIATSQLGDDAVVLGAVALLKQESEKKPTVKSLRYPLVQVRRGNKVFIDNKMIQNNFYIRADGKIKELNQNAFYKTYMQKGTVDSKILKRFCKKKTEVLIIAKDKRSVRMTKDAQTYLKNHSVAYKILPLRDAVRAYTTLNRRKALFVPQSSAQ